MTRILTPMFAAYRQNRHLLDDAAIALAVNLMGTALLFLTQVLLARVLGVSEFSLYAYSLTILTIASTLSVFGFDIAVQRFVPTALAHENWRMLRGFMKRALQVTILASIMTGLLLAGAAWLFAERMTEGLSQTLLTTSMAIPASCLLLLYSAYARGLKRPLLAVAPRLLLKPLIFIALVGLLVLGGWADSAYHAVAAELVASLLAVAFLALVVGVQLRPLFNGVAPAFKTRMWIGVTFPLFLTAGFQLLTRQTDILMLGSFLGADTVGPYAAASRISQLAAFGLLSINAVLPALVAKHLAKGELDIARNIVGVASFAIFIFSAAAAVVIWLLADLLLDLFGHAFQDAVPILHILIIGQMLNAMTGSVSFILGVTGHQKILAQVVMSTMVLNALLCAALIPMLGPNGAAIAVSTSTGLSNIVLVIICIKRVGINPSLIGAVQRMLIR